MFRKQPIEKLYGMIDNFEFDDITPIAIVYDKKQDKPKSFIEMKVFDDDQENIDNRMFVKEQLSKNPHKCPFCEKPFSNNFNACRHLKVACPFRKVKKKEWDNRRDRRYEQILKLEDNEIVKSQFPNPKLRDIAYVSGPYGAGKSTYVKNYMKSFIELFEPSSENGGDGDKTIFLISRIDNDESFRDYLDDGTMIQVDINDPDIIENPLDAKQELNNSLIIFDDYELLDKNIQKSIEITLKDVLLNGRDQANEGNDIYCIVTSHQMSNYSKTRDILNECSSITFFPKAGGVRGIQYVLKNYCGFDKDDIKKLMNLPSRWVTVYKRYPNWCLYSKGCFALHASEYF